MWKILVLQIKNMQVATSVKLDKSKLSLYVWGGEIRASVLSFSCRICQVYF